MSPESGTLGDEVKFYSKLSNAQQTLPSIVRDQFNKQGGYHYASAEKHIEILGAHLRQCRLLPVGEDCDLEWVGVWGQDPYQQPKFVTHCWFRLVDVETGYSVRYKVSVGVHLGKGHGEIPKSCGGAQSYATKYWLRRITMLPWEDDDPDRPLQEQTRGAPRQASNPEGGVLNVELFLQHANALAERCRIAGMPVQVPDYTGWSEAKGREWYWHTLKACEQVEAGKG